MGGLQTKLPKHGREASAISRRQWVGVFGWQPRLRPESLMSEFVCASTKQEAVMSESHPVKTNSLGHMN